MRVCKLKPQGLGHWEAIPLQYFWPHASGTMDGVDILHSVPRLGYLGIRACPVGRILHMSSFVGGRIAVKLPSYRCGSSREAGTRWERCEEKVVIGQMKAATFPHTECITRDNQDGTRDQEEGWLGLCWKDRGALIAAKGKCCRHSPRNNEAGRQWPKLKLPDSGPTPNRTNFQGPKLNLTYRCRGYLGDIFPPSGQL